MLGFIESGISPAFVLVIGSWYRKREQVLRTTLFYSCTGLSIVWVSFRSSGGFVC